MRLLRTLLPTLAAALMAVATQARSDCGPGCVDLGGFTATVTRMTLADRPYSSFISTRSVRATVRLQNTSAEPLILAYKASSWKTSAATHPRPASGTWARSSPPPPQPRIPSS